MVAYIIEKTKEVNMPHFDTVQKILKAITDEDLKTYRLNAAETGMTCLGHNKAASNKMLIKYYDGEIAKRGLKINTDETGKFNGPGSDVNSVIYK
tara:strand:+ start:232 stop:516 length:285 start_codon:yes stop_codon:yes gene_type:complete